MIDITWLHMRGVPRGESSLFNSLFSPIMENSVYWSLWKERWTKAGPFGRTVLPLDQALEFIASEDIFWAIQ